MIFNNGFDLDGTLLDYFAEIGGLPVVNWDLVNAIHDPNSGMFTYATIITNQGGLQFGEAGISKYPTVSHFERRVSWITDALRERNILVVGVFVSLHHPNGNPEDEARIARELKVSSIANLVVPLTDRIFRKPAPGMLHASKCDVYHGDSDEDEHAAMAAGVPFVKVERFHG